jgi:hypothetical protein
VLVGGDGDDTIEARDGIRDALIDCGAGAADVATIDLQDLRTRTTGCESVRFFASDDGPPGEIRSGVLRIGPTGRARVRLACPRAARVACRGGLSIRRPRSAAVLGRATYRVARGRTGSVLLPVPAGLRGGRALLRTRELGVSRKGPRGVSRLVVVR